jgi:hypothetical protein
MKPKVPLQPGDGGEAKHENAHNQHDTAANDVELITVVQKQLAKRGGARAHDCEYGGEADDKNHTEADSGRGS